MHDIHCKEGWLKATSLKYIDIVYIDTRQESRYYCYLHSHHNDSLSEFFWRCTGQTGPEKCVWKARFRKQKKLHEMY